MRDEMLMYQCLEEAGVDNREWYWVAIDLYAKYKEEEKEREENKVLAS